MKKRLSSCALIPLCGLILTGCSSLHRSVDPGITLEQCHFEVNRAHYHDVLDELGPPARLSATAGGFAFIYEAMEIDEKQLGLSGQTGLLQFLKMTFAGTDLERHSYLLHFNADGVLIAAGILESTEDLGTAGSVQAIISIKQIVDTTAFENDALDASQWGANLLDPLPVMLNVAQNLNTGAAGIEQSGTTIKIGQHTLEMQ
jgi:hypothetical protein